MLSTRGCLLSCMSKAKAYIYESLSKDYWVGFSATSWHQANSLPSDVGRCLHREHPCWFLKVSLWGSNTQLYSWKCSPCSVEIQQEDIVSKSVQAGQVPVMSPADTVVQQEWEFVSATVQISGRVSGSSAGKRRAADLKYFSWASCMPYRVFSLKV